MMLQATIVQLHNKKHASKSGAWVGIV